VEVSLSAVSGHLAKEETMEAPELLRGGFWRFSNRQRSASLTLESGQPFLTRRVIYEGETPQIRESSDWETMPFPEVSKS